MAFFSFRWLHGTLLLFTLAGVLGTAANLFGPRPIPWQQAWSDKVLLRAEEEGLRLVDRAGVKLLLEEGLHFFFDARKTEEYDAGHIPTAMSLPVLEFDEVFEQFAPMLTPETPLVVYCSGLECDESLDLAVRLRDLGFTNLAVYAGGYNEWSALEASE